MALFFAKSADLRCETDHSSKLARCLVYVHMLIWAVYELDVHVCTLDAWCMVRCVCIVSTFPLEGFRDTVSNERNFAPRASISLRTKGDALHG